MDAPVTVKNAALVSVRGVRQTYNKGTSGSLVVLDNVDLALHRAEIVGLLGRSGSGKSTLLRAIAGLIRPTEGTITFDGTSVAGPPKVSLWSSRALRSFPGSLFCRMWNWASKPAASRPPTAASAPWLRST